MLGAAGGRAAAAMFLTAAVAAFGPSAVVVVAILGRSGPAEQAERQSGRDHVFHSSTSHRAPSAHLPHRARAKVNSV